MRFILIHIFCISILLSACSKDNKTEKIISPDRFTALLIQMHLLEAEYTFNQNQDPHAVEGEYKKYKDLFKKFKTDSVEVSNTFDHYSDHQAELLEIYRTVLDSLTAMGQASQTVTKSK